MPPLRFAIPVLLVMGGAACADDAVPASSVTPEAEAAAPTPIPDASGAIDADAGTTDAPAPRTQVPVFIAQGKLGRTTLSCDDGHTWIANHSELPDGRCWDDTSANDVECDHHAWSSTGIVTAGDHFLATYGWGYPGMVRRSEDGVHWDDVLPGHTFAGFAYGNGHLLANDHSPLVSTDDGTTWAAGGDVGSAVGNVRAIGFSPDLGGRFFVSLQSGENTDLVASADNGTTWTGATDRPAECGNQVQGFASGGGATVLAQAEGSVCRTTDGGAHWTYAKVAAGFSSNLLYAGDAFVIWNGTERWRSTDGVTWEMAAGSGAKAIGAVSRSDAGTFVAVRGGWQVWYEQQEFYRSADGITWETLPAGAFVPSHPITGITFGWAKPTTECPL